MTAQPGARGAPDPPAGGGARGPEVLGLSERDRDYLLAYVGEHLALVRRTAAGQRPVYWILGVGFVVGLAAHAGGFVLKTWAAAAEPLALVADLLYALGWALWTGVIVVVFVQIWPEAKKREYQQALDAYQAAAGRQARAGGQAPGPASAQDP